jgi:hypothetical protein
MCSQLAQAGQTWFDVTVEGLMLPEGWVPTLSKSTGETYYYNVNTGESAWDIP